MSKNTLKIMVKGYKGFNKDLKCLGKQYIVGEVATEKEAEMCRCGLHYCTNPLDVLSYYPMIDDDGEPARYAEITDLDPINLYSESRNSKRVTKNLRVEEVISFKNFIARCSNQFENDGKFLSGSTNLCNQLIVPENLCRYAFSFAERKKIININTGMQIAVFGNESKVYNLAFDSIIRAELDDGFFQNNGNTSKISVEGNSNIVTNTAVASHIRVVGKKNSISNYYERGCVIKVIGNDNKIFTHGNFNTVICEGVGNTIVAFGEGTQVKATVGTKITLAAYVDGIIDKTITFESDNSDVYYVVSDGALIKLKQKEILNSPSVPEAINNAFQASIKNFATADEILSRRK